MKITPIASSSKGNCYVIESGSEKILIDAGVHLKKIRQAGFNLSEFSACLVSHSHMDHCGYLPKLLQYNMQIWCTDTTKKLFSLPETCQSIRHKEFFNCGAFSGMFLKLDHDVDNFGFVINGELGRDRLFYATDSANLNYIIPGLTKLMIEANYDFDLLIQSEQNLSIRKRIIETHLGIHQVEEFVKKHLDLQEIHLLHLSSNNSDEKQFKERIQAISGCPVYIASE